MNRIILIGMPCSFKSSVGRKLSKLMQLPHIDTDIELENFTNKTIVDLLAEGENTFRQCEHQVVAGLPHDPCIVSTGGGVAVLEDNMTHLRDNSTIVWLSTKADTVYHRLINSNNPRPLAMKLSQEELTQYVAMRDKLYQKYADITIATDHTTSHSIANKLYKMITKGEAK